MTVVVPTRLDPVEPHLERSMTLQPGQLQRLFIQVPDTASSAGKIYATEITLTGGGGGGVEEGLSYFAVLIRGSFCRAGLLRVYCR